MNGLTLRNRLIKAATSEGRSPGGVPGDSLARFHERFGEGGVGMTTLAYCAAEADGRIHEHMLHMDEPHRETLAALITRAQATGTKVAGQLSHCGSFTKNRQMQDRRPLGPSRTLNPLGIPHGLGIVDALSTDQIRERVRVHARAAGFMKSVGFDAIELHFGHGYAVSQFLSPRTNRRSDEYGGSLENRARFALEVLEAVREAVGEDFPLLAKISMSDGVARGTSIDESLTFASELDTAGIDAIVLSGGSSSGNPMMVFHGDSLLPGLLAEESSALMRLGLRLARPFMFKSYPYRETYFLEDALRVRERVGCAVCYVGGVCTGASVERLMNDGFDFVQLGRALLYDPDLPKRLARESDYRNGCDHCNRCASLIEAPGGIRCVRVPSLTDI
jgi:2,4-dienoyl-CoA reductase-like NADH-dependent reductase (Old Yellow Enzyme family)